jgi:DNA-binding LacI/PurR family transcriptional regulator
VLIRQSPADGYIIYSMSPRDPLVEQVQRTGAPLVYIDQGYLSRAFVGVRDQLGARLAAQHLAALGHRKIGIASLEMGLGGSGTIASPARIRGCVMPMVTARLKGYRDGLHQAIGSANVPVYECKENLIEEGRRAFQQIVAAQPRISAILAMSDLLAIGVVEEADRLGLRVPNDLSVVGFDDIPLAAVIDPPLTTVHQPHIEKGRTAAQMLLDQIETGIARKSKIYPVKLVVRNSTARSSGKDMSKLQGGNA